MTTDEKRRDLIQQLEAMNESLLQMRCALGTWVADDLNDAIEGMTGQRHSDAYAAGQYCTGKLATARMHVSQCADMLDDLGAMLHAQ